MPAQGDDPPAGPAHVPEQELDDRRGADVLDADRVLRPPNRVGEGAGALAPRVFTELLGDVEKVLDSAAADLRNGLRCVAAVVLLQKLEDAVRMLERLVHLGRLAVGEGSARGAETPLGADTRLTLAGCSMHLHARVLPGLGVVLVLV